MPERCLGDPRSEDDKRDGCTAAYLGGTKKLSCSTVNSISLPFTVEFPLTQLLSSLVYAEIRLILAKVLWHFDLRLSPGTNNWVERQEIYTLYEKGPLNVYLTPVKREEGQGK